MVEKKVGKKVEKKVEKIVGKKVEKKVGKKVGKLGNWVSLGYLQPRPTQSPGDEVGVRVIGRLEDLQTQTRLNSQPP